MQLNRPKSAHLISSSPHNSSPYSSQFKSMRFSYHISSGLPSPQPALRRTGESGSYMTLYICSGASFISSQYQCFGFSCSYAKASLHISEVTLTYANVVVSVTNKDDRKISWKKSFFFFAPISWKSNICIVVVLIFVLFMPFYIKKKVIY